MADERWRSFASAGALPPDGLGKLITHFRAVAAEFDVPDLLGAEENPHDIYQETGAIMRQLLRL